MSVQDVPGQLTSDELGAGELAPGELAELVGRVRRLTDRVDLVELIDRYLLSLDEGGFDEAWARSLFTEDVVMDFPVGSHRGIKDVTGFTAQIMDRWARTHHNGANHTVHTDGDQAAIAWNVYAIHVHHGSPNPPAPGEHFHLGGRFRGVAARTPEGWRIRRLGLRVLWTAGKAAVHVPQAAMDRAAAG